MLGVRESSLLIMLCLTAAPVRAQIAPVLMADDFRSIAEVTAAFFIQAPADVNRPPVCQELGLPCLTTRTFPDFGVAALATVYPNEIVGIAGEVSTYANPWSRYGTNCPAVGGRTPQTCPVRQINHGRSALAGLKVRTRLIKNGSTRWRLFGQVLGGPQWTDIGPRRRVLQPGVGADDYLRNGIAVHVQYDYTFAPDDKRDLSTGRFLVGIGIPLGSR